MPAVAASAPEPPPNREAVKVLAKAIGVREAARRMGLSEERVMKWSQRDPDGPWGPAALSAPKPIGRPPALSASPQLVRNAPDAMADALADDSKASRIAGSRATRAALEYAAQLDGEAAHARSQDTLTSLKGAALVHTWDDRSQTTTRINIYAQLSPHEAERPVIDV